MRSQMLPTCKCGQAIKFPKGKLKAHCPVKNCGMRWELKSEGYWAIGLFTIIFTPIFAREKACSVRTRKDRYSNYPKSSRKA
jgi:hypothetical protein